MKLDMTSVIASSETGLKEMLGVSREGGVTKVSINFSSLSLMQTCWRKAEYSLLRGLKSNLESPALLFGTAIHAGLQTYYEGQRTERSIPQDYADIMQMIGCGQWQPEWAEYLVFRAARSFALKAAPLSALPDENKRSVATGVWMLRHYFQKYLTDEYVIMRDEFGPVVERKVRMKLHEESGLIIEAHGQLDFVMMNEVTGQILPGDNKTASSLYDFYSKVKPNDQYTIYLMMAREVLGYDTNLFLVNALQVKQPPKTARGSEPDFARQITDRSDDDFAEVRFTIREFVMRFLDYSERNHFPMSSAGACTANYGTCTFIDVCAAPKQLRESIISARFQEGSYG